jgi:hypothetical protein
MNPITAQKKIAQRHKEAKDKFNKTHPHAQQFFLEREIDLGKIRQHSTHLLTAGTLAGTLLISSPKMFPLPTPILPENIIKLLADQGIALPDDPRNFLVEQLQNLLPQKVSPLSPDLEKKLGMLIEKLTGIKARANLEGERLNTSYGLIGAEQHLPRFPGDTINQHDEEKSSGITPGLGGWGYFTFSQNSLKPDDILREKYYVAVQTLYLPRWEERLKYLISWYKYRKVLVLNPDNGQAVVAVIADAGPAAWTGKQFGGSPEVMVDLGLNKGPRKGRVLLLFVDDPDNKVPLGPVNYQGLNLPKVKIAQN